MIDRTALQSFSSFAEAEESSVNELWELTPMERLAALEMLRSFVYEGSESPPRIQRVLETVEFPPS